MMDKNSPFNRNSIGEKAPWCCVRFEATPHMKQVYHYLGKKARKDFGDFQFLFDIRINVEIAFAKGGTFIYN